MKYINNYKEKIKNLWRNRDSSEFLTGFTLIEAVVVLAIFLFIIGVVITMFITVVQSQRSVLQTQRILNQITYIQEYTSRALRMARIDEDGYCITSGYNYELTREDQGGFYRGIKFINQSDSDACQEFFFDVNDNRLKEAKNNEPEIALSSSSLDIESVLFALNGEIATSDFTGGGLIGGDGIQPKITLVLKVIIGEGSNAISKIIQTSVSQRNLNVGL